MSDVRVEITRASLERLGACGEGLVVFDQVAIGGVFRADDVSALERVAAKLRAEHPQYAEWLGALLIDGYGSGYGAVAGSGYGSGDGYGYGSGYGSGYGDAGVVAITRSAA